MYHHMKPKVLLISMDTVRQDVFNPECFPQSWSVINEDFTRFPNAISSGVATPHSFPGIVTGRPVIGDGEFKTGTATIGELFRERRSVAFSNNGHLSAERGYNRGIDNFDDSEPPTNRDMLLSPSLIDRIKRVDHINNSTILTKLYSKYQSLKDSPPYSKPGRDDEMVTDWILSELNESSPDFLWGHYMDAHKPFIPEQAIRPPKVEVSQEKLGELNSYELENDPPAQQYQELLRDLYKANVRYMDKALAKLLTALRELDWYSEALIILVSDHGELFGEHGNMWHPMTIDPVDELIDVPLAVKFPHGKHSGEIMRHQVQHADIPATIAAHLDKQDRTPNETFPLSETTQRITISKSNTSIRVTGPNGYAIDRRDGSRDTYGSPCESVIEKAQSAEFPQVRTSSGVIRGIEDVERIEQLKALGYHQ